MLEGQVQQHVGMVDAVVIGAGFAGMYTLFRLRQFGMTALVFERGSDVGGTWYWNRYPGARCDTESMTYSYSFSDELEQEWNWTERYATQPEILQYARHVADRFDLRRDIRFETSVTSVVYDNVLGRWLVKTDQGDSVAARFCITAVGCLSAAALPESPGLKDFKGQWFHTGQWPHESVDLQGKRVGVIGTGSSGIQTITAIAPLVKHLHVFQRTANYSIPAWNGPLDPKHRDKIKEHYKQWREDSRHAQIGIPFTSSGRMGTEDTIEMRDHAFEKAWADGGFNFVLTYPDLLTTLETNRSAAEFVEKKIRAKVKDPAVAELLIPKGYPIGTKRICVDTGYFETFNRDNVTLVDVKTNTIERITATGVQTATAHHELDVIIFATGFDAITGPLMKLDIRGRGGATLKAKWAHGPRTYLGVGSAGFPNLFTITGPGSPCVLSNMMVSIEQHVDWIVGCISHMQAHGVKTVEPTLEAEDQWVHTVNDIANSTLYPRADSWYTGSNIPGKVRIFAAYAGGVGTYRQVCEKIAQNGYDGFSFASHSPA
jgi:cyclohexanone monooxygenase